MEIQELNTSDSEEPPHTLAHQMVLFVYNRQAIAKDTLDISFWNMFRLDLPEVELEAKALRYYFFQVVMRKVHELKGLQYAVVQYINPLFNQIREEVLESRDLVEGTDYVYEQDTPDVPSANNDELPPLRLQERSAASLASSSLGTKRYIAPSVERIRNFVAAELSEILWTKDEQETKPTLEMDECLLRVALLTKQNIPLLSCVEPGMACYVRLKQTGLIEVLPQDGDEQQNNSQDSTPRLELPVASSTPIATNSRNYDSILKYVRSKPRKGVVKKSEK